MNNYTIIEIAGQQFKVKPGDTIKVNRLEAAIGEEITIDRVLLEKNGETTTVGTPSITNRTVIAKVLEHIKDKKVRVSTFKSKSRLRRTIGHRHALTTLEILDQTPKKAPAKKEVSVKAAAKTT